MAAPNKKSEVFVFNARFCGKRNKDSPHMKNGRPKEIFTNIEASSSEIQEKIFNIKRARYEVIRFGMTGFNKEHQMNSKIAMAIQLGAKPPKKKCINYKELMEQKKKEKEESQKDERKNQYNLQLFKQKKKSNKKKKPKKQPNSIV